MVHLPPAVVGPPDPGVVPRRPRRTSATEPPEGEGWERDPDVLDTWFSSAVPVRGARLARGHAGAARVLSRPTRCAPARDIIFLWVARMIMMGIEFTGQIPFADVYVHSIIQAPDGRRMSKSLGTGIDPLDLIDGGPRPPVFERRRRFPGLRRRRGALGPVRDVLGPGRPLQRGQARPGSPAHEQAMERRPADPARRGLRGARRADAGARSRTAGSSRGWSGPGGDRRRIERFDFSHAALGLYDFVYGELCDWYLELVKPRLRAGESTSRPRCCTC